MASDGTSYGGPMGTDGRGSLEDDCDKRPPGFKNERLLGDYRKPMEENNINETFGTDS